MDLKSNESILDEKNLNQQPNLGLSIGQITSGVIKEINDSGALVTIKGEIDAVLPRNEITNNRQANIYEIIKVGDKLDFKVISYDNEKKQFIISKKIVDRKRGLEKLKLAYQNGFLVEGKVIKVLNDAIIVTAYNVDIYIHETKIGLKGEQLNSLLNQQVTFKIIEWSPRKNHIRGSIKKVKEDEFWATVKIGDHFSGPVTTITDFGAFVNLGPVDGLIFIENISWKKIKHPSEILKVGDIIDVKVKKIDYKKKRISLDYKKSDDDPWKVVLNRYKKDDIVETKVISLTPFGAFAEILPGVDGLIHISDVSDSYVKVITDYIKVGQIVKARIKEIDSEKKRVFLTLRNYNNKPEFNL